MKLTEKKIRDAQKVIEAVMAECGLWSIDFYDDAPIVAYIDGQIETLNSRNLAELYINRLHEINGTEPPPF